MKIRTIRHVNPGYPRAPDRTRNCVHCAMATDWTLAGYPTCAMPGGPKTVSSLTEMYGRTFAPVSSIEQVEMQLLGRGEAARAIILGLRTPGQVGHVFNAVNQRGTVRFLDGQTGKAAITTGFKMLFVLPTN